MCTNWSLHSKHYNTKHALKNTLRCSFFNYPFSIHLPEQIQHCNRLSIKKHQKLPQFRIGLSIYSALLKVKNMNNISNALITSISQRPNLSFIREKFKMMLGRMKKGWRKASADPSHKTTQMVHWGWGAQEGVGQELGRKEAIFTDAENGPPAELSGTVWRGILQQLDKHREIPLQIKGIHKCII